MRKKRQRKERQRGSRGWRGERESARGGGYPTHVCVAESRTDKEKARERHEHSPRYAFMCVSARVFAFGVCG